MDDPQSAIQRDYHLHLHEVLWRALRVRGNNAAVKEAEAHILQRSVADINAKETTKGRSAIHAAVNYSRSSELIDLLLNRGADVNANDNRRWTALHFASVYGHIDVVTLLLDRGADVNAVTTSRSSALHIASRNDCTGVVALLLDRGADMNAVDCKGLTALQIASQKNHVDVVALLLNRGADGSAVTTDGRLTALHIASQNDSTGVVALLLDRGADVNAVDNRRCTALHIASQNDCTRVVALLLDRGADVNAVDSKLWTALHYALSYRRMNVATLLLDRGAIFKAAHGRAKASPCAVLSAWGPGDVVALLAAMAANAHDDNNGQVWHLPKRYTNIVKCLLNQRAVDENRCTALHIAAKNSHMDVIKSLLDCGADLSSVNNRRCTALHIASEHGHTAVAVLLLDRGANVNAVEGSGCTALHVASANGHTAVVALLLDRGADANAMETERRTALHLASQEGHVDIAALLVDHFADVKAIADLRRTALHNASQEGHVDVVAFLLNRGANVNAIDIDGRTALHLASKNGHVDVVSLLLNRGADASVVDANTHITALHIASKYGHTDVVALLLNRGANVNVIDSDGWTALHNASSHNSADVVSLLLNHGADVNAVRNRNTTALHSASRNNRADVVSLLLNRGADVSAVDANGETAFQIASRRGYSRVVSIFNHDHVANASNTDDLDMVVGNVPDNCRANLLTDRSADTNVVEGTGQTTLHSASEKGHTDVVASLLDGGADANAVDKNGKTAVQSAIASGFTDVVFVLITRNATVSPQLFSSVKQGHIGILELLLAAHVGSNSSPLVDDAIGCQSPDSRRRLKECMRLQSEWSVSSGAPLPLLTVASRALAATRLERVTPRRLPSSIDDAVDILPLASLLGEVLDGIPVSPTHSQEFTAALSSQTEYERLQRELAATTEATALVELVAKRDTARDALMSAVVVLQERFGDTSGANSLLRIAETAERMRGQLVTWIDRPDNDAPQSIELDVDGIRRCLDWHKTWCTAWDEERVRYAANTERCGKRTAAYAKSIASHFEGDQHASLNELRLLHIEGIAASLRVILAAWDEILSISHTRSPYEARLRQFAPVVDVYLRAFVRDVRAGWDELRRLVGFASATREAALNAPRVPILKRQLQERAVQLRNAKRKHRDTLTDLTDAEHDGIDDVEVAAFKERVKAARHDMCGAEQAYSDAALEFVLLATRLPEYQADFRGDLANVMQLPELLKPGRSAAQYRMDRVLARAGGGSRRDVYLAVLDENGTEQQCVLKSFHLGSEKERKDFLSESRLLRSLRHPNIVSIEAVFIEDGATRYSELPQTIGYIQLDFCEKGDLLQWVRATMASNARKQAVLRGALLGLEHIHRMGVVHCDIKPQNILVDASGRGIISDFDVSSEQSARTSTATKAATRVAGTDAYLAPELIRGDVSAANASTDMYAFALTVYDTYFPPDEVTGALQRPSMTQVAHRGVLIAIPATADAALSSFLASVFSAEARERPSSRDALGHVYFVSPPPLAPGDREGRATCICCMDVHSLANGVACSDANEGSHFVCNEDFERYVQSCAADDIAVLKRRDGQITCPDSVCGRRFDSRLVADHVTSQTFGAFIDSQRKLSAAIATLELDRVWNERLEQVRQAARPSREMVIRLHKEHIEERILTLRCPRCATAFVEFEGCFALVCGTCNAKFCGWCLVDCGDPLSEPNRANNLTHRHVVRCSLRRSVDPLYGDMALFERVQCERRQKATREYLLKVGDAGIAEAVLAACATQLEVLGVRINMGE
eukprot:Opistho-2@62209